MPKIELEMRLNEIQSVPEYVDVGGVMECLPGKMSAKLMGCGASGLHGKLELSGVFSGLRTFGSRYRVTVEELPPAPEEVRFTAPAQMQPGQTLRFLKADEVRPDAVQPAE